MPSVDGPLPGAVALVGEVVPLTAGNVAPLPPLALALASPLSAALKLEP